MRSRFARLALLSALISTLGLSGLCFYLTPPSLSESVIGRLPILLFAQATSLTLTLLCLCCAAVSRAAFAFVRASNAPLVRAAVRAISDIALCLPTLIVVALLMTTVDPPSLWLFAVSLGALQGLDNHGDEQALPSHEPLPLFWPRAAMAFPAVVTFEGYLAFLGITAPRYGLGRLLVISDPLLRSGAWALLLTTTVLLLASIRALKTWKGLRPGRNGVDGI